MIRISTIFVAICMVLVAASLGLVLYSVAGISAMESAIVALTALTFLVLYNAVSMRLRDRSDVGGQIADLSRGTADLARQVAEFGRRLALVEGRVVSANSANQDRVQIVPEIRRVRHTGRIGPSADHHVQHSHLGDARALLEFRDDVIAPFGKITTAVLTHIYDDPPDRVMVDEIKKLPRELNEILSSGIGFEVQIENLFSSQVSEP